MNSKIPFFSLVMLIVAAIDSIRTLPTTAFFGSSLIFYYFLSSVLFLFPVALISAEFASRNSEEGGVFNWIRQAFGDRIGVLAIWLQWINTMVWYPTMLLFISGTTTYLVNASFAGNKMYLLLTSLTTFWLLTFLNLKGIQVSVKINSLCGLIGTLLPMGILIFLGICWILSGNSCVVSFSWKDLIPSTTFINSSNAIVTIMASFLGMELAGVHIRDIHNPQKNFPIAIGYSVLILLTTLVLGSLSIAAVVPQEDIRFVDGVMQTFTLFLSTFKLTFFVPLLAFLIILGSTGGSVNWLLSPAKGLMQAAEKGFLPLYFLHKNRHGVAYRILILQAVVVSIFCCAMHFVQSANTYYWFLMALSTGLYMLMYILLFLAALKLKRPNSGYRIPMGIRTVSCIAGLVACVMTIIVGFQPAPGTVIESKINYSMKVIAGFLLMLLPVLLLWQYQRKQSQILVK
jgi:glutamate:GABA antiporter